MKKRSTTKISKVLCILTLSIQFLEPSEAAHARKRPEIRRAATTSKANTYDKQITTFDPQGHLLQVQYAQKAAERGSSGLFLKLEGGSCAGVNEDVIIAVVAGSATTNAGTASSSSTLTCNQDRNQSMYRIHDGIMAKMTGLQGDARLLSRHLLANSLRMNRFEGGGVDVDGGADVHLRRRTAESSTRTLAEFHMQKLNNRITVKQIARLCAEVQHSLTMRPGARPLAVDAVLFGLDGRKSRKCVPLDANANQMLRLGLYRSRLTGVVEECYFCVVGGICSDRSTHTACLEELETLWSNLQQKNQQDGEDELEIIYEDGSPLSKAIVKMGQHLLKYQQKQLELSQEQSHQEGSESTGMAATVDVYLMRPNVSSRGGTHISCASCVKDQDLEYVARMFDKNVDTSTLI